MAYWTFISLVELKVLIEIVLAAKLCREIMLQQTIKYLINVFMLNPP
jgi:hypothetical protein